MMKNPPANTGDARDAGSNPGWGRFPVEGAMCGDNHKVS